MAASPLRVYKGKRTRAAHVTIPLTNGKSAKLDLIDADLVDLNWSAARGNTIQPVFYASRTDHPTGKHIKMHRVIMERVLGRQLKQYENVDHINGNGLDNRRVNLRIANQSENSANSRKQPTFRGNPTHSQYKGVSRRSDNGRWIATIKVNRKQIHLGYYDSEESAAKAYDRAAREHFGEFAKTNFPMVEA